MEFASVHDQRPFLITSVHWSLSLATTFDYMIGRPSGGYAADSRERLLGRIRAAMTIADANRSEGDPLDIPLSDVVTSFARVPSWNRARIAEIRAAETQDPWACESALLSDHLEMVQNFEKALMKSARSHDVGHSPNPSGQRHV